MATDSREIGISLGANLGNRLETIQAAYHYLIEQFELQQPILQASLYQSDPIDCPKGSPSYYNTAVEFYSCLPAQEILKITQSIESGLGRKRNGFINESRLIDIDIIYCGRERHQTLQLTIPHPKAHLRRFVLEPFCELCPQRILVGQTRSLLALWNISKEFQLPLEIIQKQW